MLYTRVGFTGTKHGLAPKQAASLRAFMAEKTTQLLAHPMLQHGDCVGADASAHDIAEELGWRTKIYAPLIDALRAFKAADEYHLEKGAYLERNKWIMNDVDFAISCPRNSFEERRSGTWHATRYAVSKGKPVFVIWPNGDVTNM